MFLIFIEKYITLLDPNTIIKINFCLSALLATLCMSLIYILWEKRENLNKLTLVIQGCLLLFLLNNYLNQAIFTHEVLTDYINGCFLHNYANIFTINKIYFIVNYVILIIIFVYIMEAEDFVIHNSNRVFSKQIDVKCAKNYKLYIINILKRIYRKIILIWAAIK